MEQIYLDNSATTKVCAPAAQAALEVMTQTFGNPSSLHRLGFEAETQMNASKKLLASVLGCAPGELLFTSGATESNNLAILGSAGCIHPSKLSKAHLVTTAVEHPSVAEPIRVLEEKGISVTRIFPREDGSFSPEDFVTAVGENTFLLSVMMVNNEVGTRLPVEEITKGVRKKNPKTLIHIDGVQAFGKLPLSFKRLDADLFSISGHKIYAPKGIGALAVKKGVRLTPMLYGGGQQDNLRPGTESTPLIAALAQAARFCRENQAQWAVRFEELKAHLLHRLAEIPGVELNSPRESAPYIVNLSVPGIRSEIMLHFLEEAGIYVSSGSACSKGAKSPTLSAMGLSPQRIDSALRLSFSYETTPQQLDRFFQRLEEGILTLKK